MLNTSVKIQLFLLLGSSFLLSCAQNPTAPRSSNDLKNIEYLLDDQAACSIPKNAQIIHLPQAHKYPPSLRSELPKNVLNFFQSAAAHSQFLIAHIISQNASHTVFDEGSRFIVTDSSKENIRYSIPTENGTKRELDAQDIAGTFNDRLPSSFSSLNKEQKNLLVELGAAFVALSLDHIELIHRTHSPSEAKSLERTIPKMWSQQKALISETHDLYERILTAKKNEDNSELRSLQKEALELSEKRMDLEKQSNQIIMDEREKILSREVHFFLKNNPHQKVFIIYGAAHDLFDEFSSDRFHTLPHHCTMPESLLKSSSYAGLLEEWADRIYLDNDVLHPSHIQNIRALYRKSYTILTNIVEEHIQEGGRKEDPSMSWNLESDKYISYSDLESFAESIYIKMIALEDLIQQGNAKASAS